MQGMVVLHEDVQIVSLAEIPPEIRRQMEGEEGDFALTRPFSRNPSKVIDANSASLLRQFRSPRTIVDGILAYSREAKVKPADVLEEAYPLIESCLRANLLVEPGASAEKIRPSRDAGDSIDNNIVVRPIQALVDSEVYQVRTPAGQLAVLKIATPKLAPSMQNLLANEAAILQHLAGAPAPRFLRRNNGAEEPPWLLAEWFDGEDGHARAQKIRETGAPDAAEKIAAFCANIIDAYAALHERGVIHGDIHPRNVLVSESGEVRIIDFGVSQMADSPAPTAARAGVAFFFEPEYAQVVRAGQTSAGLTLAGEQYGVAALVYFLLTGGHYTDFSFDRDILFRQIADDKPLPFERRGITLPAALEAVVLRALEKDPGKRFESTCRFALAFREALATFAGSPAGIAVARSHDQESRLLLERVLETISEPHGMLEYHGPGSPTASVTYGAAGIAFAAYRIACARDDGRLFAFADAWAERAAIAKTNPFYHDDVQITPETVGPVSPYHTASGVAAVQGVLATARGDRFGQDAALDRYLLETGKEWSNPDLTLGQSSVLLGLILILESNAETRPPKVVERGNQIFAGLLELMSREPEIAHGGEISYLGVAHGWAGLLYVALRWSQLTGAELPPLIGDRLCQLADQAAFAGMGARWPVLAGHWGISMPGWCNGSAGFTFLWSLAHRLLDDARYLDLAKKAATNAFESSGGGHGLCCGFAGQAYAQLNMYNHTGDQMWLRQARILVEKAADTANRGLKHGHEGLPHSLYKGDLGVAVLIAELEKPESAAMPFFESPR